MVLRKKRSRFIALGRVGKEKRVYVYDPTLTLIAINYRLLNAQLNPACIVLIGK